MTGGGKDVKVHFMGTDPPAFRMSGHATRRLVERGIEQEWIVRALAEPERVDDDPLDADVRHALKRVPERDGRVLRVVFNFRQKPWLIVSVFFDRRLRGAL